MVTYMVYAYTYVLYIQTVGQHVAKWVETLWESTNLLYSIFRFRIDPLVLVCHEILLVLIAN